MENISYTLLGGVNMLFDANKVSELLNISKVTAYAKMKLPEIKPIVIHKNGKAFVDEKGLDAIKQSLRYNQNIEWAAEAEAATTEAELLKEDIIEVLKNNIEFLKQQLTVKDTQMSAKDEQIYDIKRLLENTQVLFKQEQDKNNTILALPETIKEHDIKLVNQLTESLAKQRAIAAEEAELNRKKGLFQRFFDK
jgi:hypothetical protein